MNSYVYGLLMGAGIITAIVIFRVVFHVQVC